MNNITDSIHNFNLLEKEYFDYYRNLILNTYIHIYYIECLKNTYFLNVYTFQYFFFFNYTYFVQNL